MYLRSKRESARARAYFDNSHRIAERAPLENLRRKSEGGERERALPSFLPLLLSPLFLSFFLSLPALFRHPIWSARRKVGSDEIACRFLRAAVHAIPSRPE